MNQNQSPRHLMAALLGGQIFNGNAGIMSTQDNGMAARRQNARIQFRDSGKTMVRVGVDQAVDNPSVVGGTIVDPPPQIPPMERTNIGFEDRTNTAKIPSTLSGSVVDRSMSGARFGFQDGASLRGQVQGMGRDGGILSSGFASGGPALGGSMIGPDRGMPLRFQDGTPFLQTDPRSSLRPFSGSSLTEAGGTRPFTLPPFVDSSLTPTDRTRPLTLPPFTDNSLTDRVRTGSLPMPSVTSGSPREIGGTRPMTSPQFGGSSLRGTVDISGSPREIGGTRPMTLPQFGGSSLRGGVACFNGKSALAIPKYANMDLGTYFYATFKYKHDEPTEKTQALLYNGDCNVKPSMVLGSKTDGIFFNMKTTTGEVHTLFAPTNVPPTEWRTASVVIDGSNVVLKTDDFTEKLSFSGGVARSKCGLKIGWGQEYTNFVGCIDEFKLYRCRPEEPPKKRQDIYPEINMMNSG
ncbi:hypothetical protein FSP39_004792 [Pinctada imbricata]|uniref:Uncharacterized protein n=1 Tax=Pinctada imbricata TaxID=66713 RepID=A0AA88YAY1_PINIB|nr:hypothetical protein FSP39_004792 [Pinctada imbricata]